MKVIKYILFVSLIAISCSKPAVDIAGEYQSSEYNILEQGIAFITGKSLSIGCSLDLRSDSTYTFMTCGNIITGKWARNEEQLYLHACTNKFRKEVVPSDKSHADSLKVPSIPMVFNIKKSGSRGKKRLSCKHDRLKINLIEVSLQQL